MYKSVPTCELGMVDALVLRVTYLGSHKEVLSLQVITTLYAFDESSVYNYLKTIKRTISGLNYFRCINCVK